MRSATLAFGLIFLTSIAQAGPNGGGVLSLHATTLTYTLDVDDYTGMSGVACGQDGPAPPQTQDCPPYDPIGGPSFCDLWSLNPTSSVEAGVPSVWYIMAAFPEGSCPRLKGVAFRIGYDPAKVAILANGPSDQQVAIALPLNSNEDNSEFPSNRSGMGLSFMEARTSRLQEIWWFAGYAYTGATDAIFEVGTVAGSTFFVDDSTPRNEDSIWGLGFLGLGGTDGYNTSSWELEPLGGCCDPAAGNCVFTSFDYCLHGWLGFGVPCNTVNCPVPPPTGSCCFADGSCAITPQAACSANWTLSGTCDPNLCPAPEVEGACCSLSGTCALMMRTTCTQPGVWHADWPLCDPNPCPVPQGACCTLDGACTLTAEAGCDPSSIWRGDLTSCEPNRCPALPAERTSWGQIKNRYR